MLIKKGKTFQDAYNRGKRHAEDGIVFYPEGQPNSSYRKVYAQGYLDGKPVTSLPAESKKCHKPQAEVVASTGIMI